MAVTKRREAVGESAERGRERERVYEANLGVDDEKVDLHVVAVAEREQHQNCKDDGQPNQPGPTSDIAAS